MEVFFLNNLTLHRWKITSKNLEKYGIEFKLNTTIGSIGSSKVENVQFSDGTTVESNLVIFATESFQILH